MAYTSQVVNYFRYKQTNFARYYTYEIDQTNVSFTGSKIYDGDAFEENN